MQTTPAALPAAARHRTPAAEAVVLAEVVRSGFVEGRHRGSLVLLDADGTVSASHGDVRSPMLPRSCAKLAQATAIATAGVDLPGHLTALSAASHSGEDFHVAGVLEILATAGLSPDLLRTPADLPYEREHAHLRAGGDASPLLMNCSGKHAAMLVACAVNGWDLDTYLAPDHPLQVLARDTLAAGAGESVAWTATDGCGAPVHAISLLGLARLYRSAVLSAPGSPARRVADAMRAFPEYVAGDARLDTRLMRAVPGLLTKVGAEAVQVGALPDGRAFALKIEDGAHRAVRPVFGAVLRRLGVADEAVEEICRVRILGGGLEVGRVRAADWLG
ncbi:asparaginase [Longispora fulva]|uniref:L-asparaginase II n=1 Tax=Longispora fulva TaxID=619741 RepID=A0A8J7KJY8_9ACTN|nr:asparaginase [Longispora fulva]MBG6137419.1 L-asparaginase II [Longispora fulva]GIG61226.1 asparaginase [Longispora fulva]